MNFKSRLYITAALLFGCPVFAPFTSAQAGQLFPPANIGTNPNIPCQSNQVLGWTGESVACINPTPGVSVSCPAGQLLTGIVNGAAQCTQLSYLNTNLVCAAGTSAGPDQIAILGYYTKYLGRCADATGFGYWSNAYTNLGTTLAQIQYDIANSPEAASYAQYGVNDPNILNLCPPLNGVSYHYRQYTQYCDPD
jgi:hypothetical protein